MKKLITVLAVSGCLANGPAFAVTRTIGFEASPAGYYISPDFYSILGVANGSAISGSFSFETDAVPLIGSVSASAGQVTALFSYTDFSIRIGAYELYGKPFGAVGQHYIQVYDARLLNGDLFQIVSSPIYDHVVGDIDVLQLGVALFSNLTSLFSADDSFSGGLNFVTASLLNNFVSEGYSPIAFIQIRNSTTNSNPTASFGNLKFFDITDPVTAVPIPAGAVLLLTGIAGLAAAGNGRRLARRRD